MNTALSRLFAFCVVLSTAMVIPSVLRADEVPEAESVEAVTVENVEIDSDQLRVLLRPMTEEELRVELDAWLGLLRAKIREVGVKEIELLSLPEGETDSELEQQLVQLRTQEAGITERVRIVVEASKSKGGDTAADETFLDSVSSLTTPTDSTTYRAALLAAIRSWIEREDGGQLWAKRVGLALAILIVTWLISRFAGRVAARVLARNPRVSNLLENFARRTAGGLVMVVGILTALGTLGVQIGPLMATLGAGGFIVGFALQETLGSFASGLMIMVYRPFDVDDYVSVAGVEGTVKEMSLVSTSLITVDNKVVIIPNTKAWGDTIINFTGRDLRRVDLVFGIGYDDDIKKAMNVLKEVAAGHDLVLEDPPVAVIVDSLGDSCVDLACRPWVKTSDYWAVHWDLTEQVKIRFDAEGISIPFPQRDVHVFNETSAG